MSAETEHPIQLHLFGLPRTAGVARLRERDAAERSRRALAAAVAGLGLALLGVLVPIAHFVLVPGFLIGGIVVAVRRLGEHASVVAVGGTCPRCNEARTFEGGGRLRPAFRVQCPTCSNTLDVEGLPGAAAVPPTPTPGAGSGSG